MQQKSLTAVLVIGLVLGAFAMGNYATGQSPAKKQRWEYTLLKHSPHLKESGTDFKEIEALGKDGWQLASSYTVRGEVVISIFQRPK